MRTFHELMGRDQGVYLTREMIKKELDFYLNPVDETYSDDYAIGLNRCIDLCNDLLDIATLGEIKDDIQKENGTI